MTKKLRDEELNNDEELDLKKWLGRMLKMWPAFLLSLLLFAGLSILYLVYAKPVYEASAAIMVKDDKKGAELMDNSTLKEMGLGGNNKLVENEIEVLKSPDILEATIRRLNLFLDISRVGRVRSVPVFGNEIPFSIDVSNPENIRDADSKGANEINWQITLTGQGFFLKSKTSNTTATLRAGEFHTSDGIRFRCVPNTAYVPEAITDDIDSADDLTYHIRFVSINDLVTYYGKKISIDQATKLATVIDLEVKDKNEKKAVGILQSLIYVYNQTGLQDKNRVNDSTINFLNERLALVSNQLQTVEGSVEKFKSKNKVTDISVDEQQFLTLAQQVDVQKAQSQTQLNIISAMEANLTRNQDNPQLVPSTLGIEEPTLGVLIEQHNQLVLQRERIVQKSGPKNPLLIDVEEQIRAIRSKMLNNIHNLKQGYEISLQYAAGKDALLNNKIERVPKLEKELIQITRNKTVQETIYAFLLQKREESAITRASSLEDSRTIAEPRSTGKKWPKGFIVLGLGLFLGLVTPLLWIATKDYLNNKVGDVAQVAQYSSLPLLGTISHVKRIASPIVVNGKSRTAVAEQIRQIRTSISFTGKGNAVKSILTTSFQPGDGKSFISLNLAASYALLDKKTVLLEFDLRKPHITKYLGIEAREGLSSILSGKASLRDMLIEVEGYNGNLFLIPAGYLPPNPSELISNCAMADLMKELETEFDYVIIDTPPFSLVTDAALLQQYATISLVVLRQNYTSRNAYPSLEQFARIHADKSIYLLLNDVGKTKRYQDGEGYGYKYKGYYQEDNR